MKTPDLFRRSVCAPRWTRSVAVLALALLEACGGKESAADGEQAAGEAPSTAPAGPEGDEPKAGEDGAAQPDGESAADAKEEAGGPSAPDGGDMAAEGGAEAGGDAEGGAEAADGADDGAGAGAGEAQDEQGGEAAPNPAAMLEEVKNKKTSDDKAFELLAQAEAAGATPKELSKAANARGEALHATPDRAEKFFVWAADKDPKNPDPKWNLAKQAAMSGDIPTIKEHLTAVKERGGKKLLQQIEFDPMWEIVADDPDVRALLK